MPSVSTLAPQAAVGDNVYVFTYGNPTTSRNYFHLIQSTGIDTWCDLSAINTSIQGDPSIDGGAAGWGGLTPIQAYQIDSKIDDGMPFTGNVTADAVVNQAVAYNLAPALAPAAGVCVSNASGNPYNITPSTGGNSVACDTSFGFQ
jgi:hypothetical protein